MVLTRRALNRATLARQLLLDRADLTPLAAVEHLAGLQAQTPHTWYGGLWSRLADFDPRTVADLLTERQVVRIALMRGTIHLVTAADCLALRPLIVPVLDRAYRSNFGRRLAGVDLDELVAAGRALVEEQPLTFAELGRRLAQRWPDRDPDAMNQAVRAYLPLVQVPPRGIWGRSGPIAHTTAQAWLGRDVAATPSVEDLVRRYLRAFGPATVKDAQTWSGLTRLSEVFERLRPELVTFAAEDGRELFDLPDAPRPDPDTPAPARMLYDFDNLLLSHADRDRVITDGYRRRVPLFPDNYMPCLVLVDGFTRAHWQLTRTRGAATLTVEPFGRPLARADAAAVIDEGTRLLAFLAPGKAHDVRLVPPQDAPS